MRTVVPFEVTGEAVLGVMAVVPRAVHMDKVRAALPMLARAAMVMVDVATVDASETEPEEEEAAEACQGMVEPQASASGTRFPCRTYPNQL